MQIVPPMDAMGTRTAKYVDLMRVHGDRDALLTWARLWRAIAAMHFAPTVLQQ